MDLNTSENQIFQIASDFINKSNHPVFLTGKAGTGKTTFLKYIKENTLKTSVIVAPTGVAAMNAGGTTIHSFFQLPFTPFVPLTNTGNGNDNTNDKHDLITHLRMSSERKELLRELELLIIDEISMVRADVLDSIDVVLRYVRNSNSPFGGVQVLYIGDMYQLPPVIKSDEWNLLKGVYSAPFFFCSQVIASQPPVCIELKKVYRQRDEHFIDILNKVRNNEMDQQGYELLHSRFVNPPPMENIIILTTHNAKADAINTASLKRIDQKESAFAATIEGIFYESAFPAEENLIIKPGARVMFLKNDVESRRYFNGKIGVVHKVEDESIWIECENDKTNTLIELKRDSWRNIKYTLNNQGRVEEEELGSFRQFPIRLAWAITIHKSQGLTFEKVIIDAAQAFAPGQVYVALSRCTSLIGLYLTSAISFQSLQSDPRIVAFAQEQDSHLKTMQLLETSSRENEFYVLSSIFDFTKIDKSIAKVFDLTNSGKFSVAVSDWTSIFKEQWRKIFGHATNFQARLTNYLYKLQDDNNIFKQRITDGSLYFINELEKLVPIFENCPIRTDNRQIAKEHDNLINTIIDGILLKIHFMKGCIQDPSIAKFYQQKRSYVKKSKAFSSYSGKSALIPEKLEHPELYVMLKNKRDQLCIEHNLPVYLVCNSVSIQEMATYLPLTQQSLEKISGFGKIKVARFGKHFISIITEYCDTNSIVPPENNLPVKRLRKATKSLKEDTKKITFDKFTNGKSIDEIAKERNLSTSTIESHLAFYVKEGAISIDSLVKPDIINTIRAVREKAKGETLSGLKLLLPDIGYGDIRFYMASEKE